VRTRIAAYQSIMGLRKLFHPDDTTMTLRSVIMRITRQEDLNFVIRMGQPLLTLSGSSA